MCRIKVVLYWLVLMESQIGRDEEKISNSVVKMIESTLASVGERIILTCCESFSI